MKHLEALLDVYPDACVVWTHRDPLTATGSFCSLLSLSHQAFMGRVDTQWLGENCSWQAVEHANRIMDFRDRFGEDRVVDVDAHDLVSQVGKAGARHQPDIAGPDDGDPHQPSAAVRFWSYQMSVRRSPSSSPIEGA